MTSLRAAIVSNGKPGEPKSRLATLALIAAWKRELHDLETELVAPEARWTVKRLEQMLHPDFIELGSTGRVYDRNTMIEMLSHQAPPGGVIRDFDIHTISPDTALVTYRSIGESGEEARRSSLWVRFDGRWRIRFHQGTRIPNRWGRVS